MGVVYCLFHLLNILLDKLPAIPFQDLEHVEDEPFPQCLLGIPLLILIESGDQGVLSLVLLVVENEISKPREIRKLK